MRLQQPKCFEILDAEIRECQPKRIAFLTGLDWVAPFLDHLGWKHEKVSHQSIEAYGHLPGGRRFVIGPHPQARKEGPLIEAICKYLA
jgi:hypothetical protein